MNNHQFLELMGNMEASNLLAIKPLQCVGEPVRGRNSHLTSQAGIEENKT